LQSAVDRAGGAAPQGEQTFNPEMEVKRPGDKDWVRYTPKTTKEYAAVMEVSCPDGSDETPVEVLPE